MQDASSCSLSVLSSDSFSSLRTCNCCRALFILSLSDIRALTFSSWAERIIAMDDSASDLTRAISSWWDAINCSNCSDWEELAIAIMSALIVSTSAACFLASSASTDLIFSSWDSNKLDFSSLKVACRVSNSDDRVVSALLSCSSNDLMTVSFSSLTDCNCCSIEQRSAVDSLLILSISNVRVLIFSFRVDSWILWAASVSAELASASDRTRSISSLWDIISWSICSDSESVLAFSISSACFRFSSDSSDFIWSL